MMMNMKKSVERELAGETGKNSYSTFGDDMVLGPLKN
jgi:hypothetical protein